VDGGNAGEASPRPVLVAVGGKYEKGLSPEHRYAEGTFTVVELVDALTHTYRFDAHLVAYVIEGVRAQPRLLKDHLYLIDRPVTVSVFFCDIDLPDGSGWTDELTAEFIAKYEQLDILKTAGIYHTRGGLRVVQPLAKPLPVPESEVYHRRWLHQLEAAGLQVDWACTDWTRLFRLPNVRRDRRPYRSPYLNLDRMRRIELEPIALAELVEHRASRRRTAASRPHFVPAVVPWTNTVPPVWQPRIERLAEAVRAVSTEWHTLFLALAGAMLGMDVPYEHVPLLCRAISSATGNDSKTTGREGDARTTVERYLRGQAVTGFSQLRKHWPRVAAALTEVLASRHEARLRAATRADVQRRAPLDPKHALAAYEDAIRTAPHGVSIVAADSALGKFSAIVNVAGERAAKPYASPTARGTHVPPGSRTSICMADNVKAQSMVDELRANGVPTEFIRGPLSFRNDDGSRTCKLYDVAKPLVEGGQIMQKELCEGRGRDPCQYYATCTARLGTDGPEDARVVVGSHAMAGQLDLRAGKTGLFIIDQIPELLETQAITLDDLAVASNCIDIFVGAYGTALRPALMALTAWVASLAPLSNPTTAVVAVAAAADAILPEELDFALRAVVLDSGTAIDCARAAPLQDKFGDAPPLMFHEIRHAIASKSYSAKIGNASRVLQAVHRAIVRPDDFVTEVVSMHGERSMRITGVKKRVVNALCRDGVAVILAEGSVVPQAPVIAKIIGYEPPLRVLRVADAAPIARTLLRTSAASRRRWAPAGKFVLDVSLVTALRAVMDWAREDDDTRRLAIVTFEPVALALQAALSDHADASVTARWIAAGQYEPGLQQVLDQLGPILRGWSGREWQSQQPRELIIAGFGDAAGRAAIRDVDALVTLGDPWPGRGGPEASAAFLGDPGAHEARGEAECRAALELAHARLEPFDRRHPGRALHVGNVLPAGIGWSMGKAEIRQHTGGRPRAASAMTTDDFLVVIKQLGGMSAAARALACSRGLLRAYGEGRSAIPAAVAERLRHLVDKST
jgi:hypothetical protein